MSVEMLLPPGYTSAESMKRIAAAKLTAAQKPKTAEDLIEAGVVIVGSPATCRARLEEYRKLAGFGTVLVKTQFGTLPADLTRKIWRCWRRKYSRISGRTSLKAAAE